MTGQRQHQWQKIKRKCNKISSAERRDHISATPEGLKLTMRQAQSSSTLEIHVKRPRHPHTYMIAASLDSLNQSQAVQLCLKETTNRDVAESAHLARLLNKGYVNNAGLNVSAWKPTLSRAAGWCETP